MEYGITEFTPWSGLAGGLMIGLAAALLLFMVGRIAGISSIAAGLMSSDLKESAWRLVFLLGLILGALLYSIAAKRPLQVDIQSGLPIMFAGGFLVGFGTRLGSGCTAGHGICGISRLSARSVTATAVFFVTGIATVYIVRHIVN